MAGKSSERMTHEFAEAVTLFDATNLYDEENPVGVIRLCHKLVDAEVRIRVTKYGIDILSMDGAVTRPDHPKNAAQPVDQVPETICYE